MVQVVDRSVDCFGPGVDCGRTVVCVVLFEYGGGPGGLFGGGGCGGSCCGGWGLFWILFSFIHFLHIFLKEFRFPFSLK